MSALTLRRVSDITPEHVSWLWPQRIARGKITLLAGHPGLGKSQMTASLAATVTRGAQWPVDGGTCEPAGAFFLSAEDDPNDTIRPRLEAAGADLDCCFILEAGFVEDDKGVRGFDLSRDVDELDDQLGRAAYDGLRPGLVIIDPITAYLGKTNSHNTAEVRGLLAPLSALASRHGVAVVGVTHLNKSATAGADGDAMRSVSGSNAFVAAARAAYLVTRDPDNRDRRLLLPIKNNLGNDRTGYAFTIEPARITNGIETSRIVWNDSVVSITADEAIAPQQRGAQTEAISFLQALLANGAVPSKEVAAQAAAAGISSATLRRATEELRLVHRKLGLTGGWVLQLPNSKMPLDPEHSQPANMSTFEDHEHLRQAGPTGW